MSGRRVEDLLAAAEGVDLPLKAGDLLAGIPITQAEARYLNHELASDDPPPIDPTNTVNAAYDRAPLVGDRTGFMNLPWQTQDGPFVAGADQPQYVGFSTQSWQTVLTVALPYARLNGVPRAAEILPGLNEPLNDTERLRLQQILDAEV